MFKYLQQSLHRIFPAPPLAVLEMLKESACWSGRRPVHSWPDEWEQRQVVRGLPPGAKWTLGDTGEFLRGGGSTPSWSLYQSDGHPSGRAGKAVLPDEHRGAVRRSCQPLNLFRICSIPAMGAPNEQNQKDCCSPASWSAYNSLQCS